MLFARCTRDLLREYVELRDFMWDWEGEAPGPGSVEWERFVRVQETIQDRHIPCSAP